MARTIYIERGDDHFALTDATTLVAIVAEGTNHMIERRGEPPTELAYQAQALASPVLNYEEAARDLDTWIEEDGVWMHEDDANRRYGNARDLIEGEGFEPYDREVFEHWAVDAQLGSILQARGERVDTDFAGLVIWARTSATPIEECPVLAALA